MRRHRFFIVAMALCGAFFLVHLPLLASVIGLAFCAWVIAATLLPAPADQIGDKHEPASIRSAMRR